MNRTIGLISGVLSLMLTIGLLVGSALAQDGPLGGALGSLNQTATARANNAAAGGSGIEAGVGFGGGQGLGIAQTVEARSTEAAANAQARATGFAATTDALSGNIQGTATAAFEGLQARLDTREEQIVATVDALSTRAAQAPEIIEATAQAAAADIREQIETEFEEELEELLSYISEYAEISFDAEAGTMSATFGFNESTFNTILGEALVAEGLSADAVAVDFVPEGVFITAENFSYSDAISGRLVVLTAVDAVDGELVLTVLYATVNDVALPDAAVATLNQTIGSALDGALSYEYNYVYYLDDVFTTNEELVMSVTVNVAALAQLSVDAD